MSRFTKVTASGTSRRRRSGDELISSMPVGTAGEVTSTELYEVVVQNLR